MRKKSTTITRREQDTLNYIKEFMFKNNVTPTIREICTGLGIKSSSSVHIHFMRLIDLGYIIPFDNNTDRITRYAVKGMSYKETKRGK